MRACCLQCTIIVQAVMCCLSVPDRGGVEWSGQERVEIEPTRWYCTDSTALHYLWCPLFRRRERPVERGEKDKTRSPHDFTAKGQIKRQFVAPSSPSLYTNTPSPFRVQIGHPASTRANGCTARDFQGVPIFPLSDVFAAGVAGVLEEERTSKLKLTLGLPRQARR